MAAPDDTVAVTIVPSEGSGFETRRFELNVNEQKAICFGRSKKENDYVLELPGVSWKHARIKLWPGGIGINGTVLGIRDLSTNGCGMKLPHEAEIKRLRKDTDEPIPSGSTIVCPLKVKSASDADAEKLRVSFTVYVGELSGTPMKVPELPKAKVQSTTPAPQSHEPQKPFSKSTPPRRHANDQVDDGEIRNVEPQKPFSKSAPPRRHADDQVDGGEISNAASSQSEKAASFADLIRERRKRKENISKTEEAVRAFGAERKRIEGDDSVEKESNAQHFERNSKSPDEPRPLPDEPAPPTVGIMGFLSSIPAQPKATVGFLSSIPAQPKASVGFLSSIPSVPAAPPSNHRYEQASSNDHHQPSAKPSNADERASSRSLSEARRSEHKSRSRSMSMSPVRKKAYKSRSRSMSASPARSEHRSRSRRSQQDGNDYSDTGGDGWRRKEQQTNDTPADLSAEREAEEKAKVDKTAQAGLSPEREAEEKAKFDKTAQAEAGLSAEREAEEMADVDKTAQEMLARCLAFARQKEHERKAQEEDLASVDMQNAESLAPPEPELVSQRRPISIQFQRDASNLHGSLQDASKRPSGAEQKEEQMRKHEELLARRRQQKREREEADRPLPEVDRQVARHQQEVRRHEEFLARQLQSRKEDNVVIIEKAKEDNVVIVEQQPSARVVKKEPKEQEFSVKILKEPEPSPERQRGPPPVIEIGESEQLAAPNLYKRNRPSDPFRPSAHKDDRDRDRRRDHSRKRRRSRSSVEFDEDIDKEVSRSRKRKRSRSGYELKEDRDKEDGRSRKRKRSRSGGEAKEDRDKDDGRSRKRKRSRSGAEAKEDRDREDSRSRKRKRSRSCEAKEYRDKEHRDKEHRDKEHRDKEDRDRDRRREAFAYEYERDPPPDVRRRAGEKEDRDRDRRREAAPYDFAGDKEDRDRRRDRSRKPKRSRSQKRRSHSPPQKTPAAPIVAPPAPRIDPSQVTAQGRNMALAAKDAGNKAFQAQNFTEAIKHYSYAIQFNPTDAVFFSNRSGAYVAVGKYAEAFSDAEECVRLRPEWWKAYSRKGTAEMQLEKYGDSERSFVKALGMASGDLPPKEEEDLKAKVNQVRTMKAMTSSKSGKRCY